MSTCTRNEAEKIGELQRHVTVKSDPVLQRTEELVDNGVVRGKEKPLPGKTSNPKGDWGGMKQQETPATFEDKADEEFAEWGSDGQACTERDMATPRSPR